MEEPSSGRSAVFPWQSNMGLWPRGSEEEPCLPLPTISSHLTASVAEARLWPDSQHLEPAASYRDAWAVVWLSSC